MSRCASAIIPRNNFAARYCSPLDGGAPRPPLGPSGGGSLTGLTADDGATTSHAGVLIGLLGQLLGQVGVAMACCGDFGGERERVAVEAPRLGNGVLQFLGCVSWRARLAVGIPATRCSSRAMVPRSTGRPSLPMRQVVVMWRSASPVMLQVVWRHGLPWVSQRVWPRR